MARPIAGRKGRLYVALASSTASAEPVANLNKYDISFETDDIDVTVFGDRNKQTVSGLPDSSGSFAGFYDTASDQLYTAAVDGADRRFYLYPTTDDLATYWFGTATFDFKVENDVAGAVAISGGFNATSDVNKN